MNSSHNENSKNEQDFSLKDDFSQESTLNSLKNGAWNDVSERTNQNFSVKAY
ncbi:hypothetical protein A3Q56_07393 [Intoshia linei]|uniref:Uncharacterized protein n=1 Tax=Intoshia linei TaxID=1819745 RepID=A0A177ASD7_9BILA|nr:hypothetical protein A3Q56_07393 [Intoshia linei]